MSSFGTDSQGDVGEERHWIQVVEMTANGLGAPEILINAAGISARQVAEPLSAEGWMTILRVNLLGAWLGIRAVLPFMRGQQFGRILNIGAVAARYPFPLPESAAYSASKAGLEAITRSVALEVAPEGILVNAIAPGPVATAMTASMPTQLREEITRQLPVGTWADPDTIASLAMFLVSPECRFLTGQIIDVDGGLGISALHTARRGNTALEGGNQ